MMTRLRRPSACAPSRCATSPRKLRSRAHTCRIGSTPVSRREPRAHRDVRHARRRARAVGDVDDVDAAGEQLARPAASVLREVEAGRRGQLDRHRELARGDPRAEPAARRRARTSAAVRARRRSIATRRWPRDARRACAPPQHAHRAEHRARVLGRRAAAAADDAHAGLQHAPREHAEVLGVRDVERAALDRRAAGRRWAARSPACRGRPSPATTW